MAVVVGVALVVAVASIPATAYQRPGRTERVSVASDGTQGDDISVTPAISDDGRYVAFASSSAYLAPRQADPCSPFPCSEVYVHDLETRVTERVSVASDGTEANAGSGMPSVSGDGRYVAFASFASNLVPGDVNGAQDVFVHDRQTGTTELVSVASGGAQGDAGSSRPSISADGRYVAFASFASNLVAGDANGAQDVFLHDRETGVTELVSVGLAGIVGDGASFFPSVSADGRYVAFASNASNLAPGVGVTNLSPLSSDVFVRDRQTGVTERASVASDGAEGDGLSTTPAISADGRHVAFASQASNLVPNDTNGTTDVFVHDRQSGATERVSVASDGAEANDGSGPPAVSADGRHVLFLSQASNLVPDDTNQRSDVFVHDRHTGATERASVASDGAEANDGSPGLLHAISGDGRHVAFDSAASNLVPGDTNDRFDVFVRDRGPALGVGELSSVVEEDRVTVSGWVTFSGSTLASADAGDAAAAPPGAGITGASVVYRTEQEDLLLRLQLTSLPAGGVPGVVYGWSFSAGDTSYEVRALRVAVTSDLQAGPYFALYTCAPDCTETTRLSGGVGTTGAEVRASLPLTTLGAEDGATLTDLTVWTALGEAAPGALVTLDEVDLPEAAIPVARVELATAPVGSPTDDLAFEDPADLTQGRFSGTLDAFRPGDDQVWVRACLAEVCGEAMEVIVR